MEPMLGRVHQGDCIRGLEKLKRKLLFAEHLHDHVLRPDAAHRHAVFSIPKRLRLYFRYDRQRNGLLFDAAWHALRESFKAAARGGVPGAVMALHTAGDLVNFHPHIHALLTAGVVLDDGSFQPVHLEAADVQQRFENQLFELLRNRQLIDTAVIEQMQSWPHSGFSVWLGPPIQPADADARLFVSQYVHKGALQLRQMEILEAGGTLVVRYRKVQHRYEDYEPLEFLALLAAHVPDKWEQTIRYLGAYSARTRGKRRQQMQSAHNASTFTLDQPSDKPAPSSTWARLIKQVYEVDPLVCRQCGGPMKIIAFITDPDELQRICRHLGVPEYRAPPPLTPAAAPALRYEPLDS